MPVCCILNCRMLRKGSRNQSEVSYHRFPRNYELRKKWLDAIGVENINSHHKTQMICSLHFDERSFNRTLDVVRLRDNSVPSKYRMPFVEALENSEEEEFCNQNRIIMKEDSKNEPHYFMEKSSQTESLRTIEMKQKFLIQKLNQTCKNQRIKIKCLNEKVRKRNIRIAALQDTTEIREIRGKCNLKEGGNSIRQLQDIYCSEMLKELATVNYILHK